MVLFKIFIAYILDTNWGEQEAGTLKVVSICIANRFPVQTSRKSTGNVIILPHHTLKNSYLCVSETLIGANLVSECSLMTGFPGPGMKQWLALQIYGRLSWDGWRPKNWPRVCE